MDIVIFGVGDYFNSRKSTIENQINIVGYIDNNPAVHGKHIGKLQIVKPSNILTMVYDFVVVMSVFAFEMKRQLEEMGVPKQKIKSYNEFYGELEKSKLVLWFGKSMDRGLGLPRILVIFNFMRYSSAYTLNLNIIDALINQGLDVSVATVAGEKACIKEIQEKGITVLTYGNLHFAEPEELFWIKNYDCVIANNVYMVDCVSVISELRPVIWWLHEPKNYVKATIDLDESYNQKKFNNIDICAVSEKARDDYWQCDRGKKIKILPIGIKDERVVSKKAGIEKIVFATIGYVGPIKGQDIFIDAISKLSEAEKEKAEFWIVGHIGEVGYGAQIQDKARQEKSVKIVGEKSKQELNELYGKIDIVVIASRTETLSLVAIEGMMHGKACIVSDSAGIAEYIRNGENGFLFRSEDTDELANIMRKIILDRSHMETIGRKGRKTYNEVFSLDTFSKRLKEEIEICIRDWNV